MTLAVLVCIAALILDRLLGEPSRWHPLVGLGWCIDRVEGWLNRDGQGSVAAGALAVALVVSLPLALAHTASALPAAAWVPLSVVVLWAAIGYSSLIDHGMAVYRPLVSGDLDGARERVGMMVSRDTSALDEPGVAAATTESVLENGADAVFASLFWFLVAGLPGLVLHRVVNTLDAMWGYRSSRFNQFGRFAARLDDVLNWIPARLTALSYALAGNLRQGLACWQSQAPQWDSPNAGPVMASGAGALSVQLGGPAPYRDGWKTRPVLGEGEAASAEAIPAACALVRRALGIWLLAGIMLAFFSWLLAGVT